MKSSWHLPQPQKQDLCRVPGEAESHKWVNVSLPQRLPNEGLSGTRLALKLPDHLTPMLTCYWTKGALGEVLGAWI